MNRLNDSPHNILIIRLSAIGDVILASPLIPVLRAAYPRARLVWLTEEGNEELLQSNPRLDRVMVWPRRRWGALWREGRYRQWVNEFRALAGELRGERFDWVLDTQGLLKSGAWAWLSGGKHRVGLGSREGSRWLMHRVVDRHSENDRIGIEYFNLALSLGLEPARFDMDIVPSGQDLQAAEKLLAGVARPFAVICPFTTRPQKHWFDERWAELARRLMTERGLAVVMLGGPTDLVRAEAIAALAPGILVLVGRTRLGQCAAIIEQAELLIGVDTGLTHLGIAMKTPTLALFGSTKPYLNTGTPNAKVLYEAMACSPCQRNPTCAGEFTCMRRHTPESVLAAVDTLPGKNR
ncbi:MAG: glycosyltransferase family 9 protein [Methylococcaceae bacterium]|nr:glycosyltransferase family 9 protein [Methylococcaceae bacterium]